MNNLQPKIDVHKVVDTIKENFRVLREGFDSSILTQEERDEYLKRLEHLKTWL